MADESGKNMNKRNLTLAVIAAGMTASVTVNAGVVTIAGVGLNPLGQTEAWIAAVYH